MAFFQTRLRKISIWQKSSETWESDFKFYIFPYPIFKEYRYWKNVIHHIDSKNEWLLLSVSFGQVEFTFVLTLENAFYWKFHFKANRKSIGSTKNVCSLKNTSDGALFSAVAGIRAYSFTDIWLLGDCFCFLATFWAYRLFHQQ